MGLYISDKDVEIRVVGKIRFTNDETDANKMQYSLLRRLISEAEAEVEMDLSARYAVPLQGPDGSPFTKLVQNQNYRMATNMIRTLCELQAVMRLLETDFGRGTAVNGEKYSEGLKKRYDSVLGKIMDVREDKRGGKGWKYPPLPGLRLAWHNEAADDGFSGMVLTTSDGLGAYPSQVMNSPGESFFSPHDNSDDPWI